MLEQAGHANNTGEYWQTKGVPMRDLSYPPEHDTVPRGEVERNVLLVTYVLYGLGFFVGISTIAGVIINHVKLSERRDRITWSHHRWLVRTFWFSVLWGLVCLVLSGVVIGLIGYPVLWLWGLYRVVRGALAFAAHKPMPGVP